MGNRDEDESRDEGLKFDPKYFSNAEMVNTTYRICDREVVNAGISGAKMIDMNGHWEKFEFSRSPSAVIIMIGTNDLNRKRNPTQPKYLAEFEQNADRLIQK